MDHKKENTGSTNIVSHNNPTTSDFLSRKSLNIDFDDGTIGSDVWKHRSGPINFRMNNDYLFKALMQTSKKTLALFLSSLLDIECHEKDISIENPIELGEKADEKSFILDLKVTVGYSIINVEMQIAFQTFWKERFLSYLCRIFDRLKKGMPYSDIQKTVHIGILDFVPPDLDPEFYSRHAMCNISTGKVFSDKMQLNVLCLQYSKLATENDIRNGLLMWSRFFTAKTWEDLKMVAKDYPVMEKPISYAIQLSEEERIQEQIFAREDAIRVRMSELEESKRLHQELDQTMYKLDQAVQELDQTTQELNQTTQELNQTTQELNQAKQELDDEKALRMYYQELLAKNGITTD